MRIKLFYTEFFRKFYAKSLYLQHTINFDIPFFRKDCNELLSVFSVYVALSFAFLVRS